MSDFKPYITSDGSVGLYNSEYDDIYHSAAGAISEAYEKFILPIDYDLLLSKEKINVLDICYGIGYNTKSFLNFIFSKINFKDKSKWYYPIHTNNIFDKKSLNIDKIYTDNIFNKINIKVVDNDEKLIFLSPFIKTGIKKIKNKNVPNENITKYLKSENKNNFYKISNEINFLIFEKIRQNTPDFVKNQDINSILSNKGMTDYFEPDLLSIFKFYQNSANTFKHGVANCLNLHNIYYRYLTKRYKSKFKSSNINNVNIEFCINDAREIIKNEINTYNIIFLDAFTPSKCPCLWSYDFFKELYRILDYDGLLLTYSKSATVRSAMIECGFYVGYNYSADKKFVQGTICSKNKSLIKYPLSEDDLGLLNTTAGIFYRDENLTGQNEAIIEARNLEVKNSKRMSSTKYMKMKNKANY